MQQDNLKSNNLNLALVIGTVMFSCFLIFDVYIFFEKTVLANKLLAAGAIPLILFLLVPGWMQIFKAIKQSQKNN